MKNPLFFLLCILLAGAAAGLNAQDSPYGPGSSGSMDQPDSGGQAGSTSPPGSTGGGQETPESIQNPQPEDTGADEGSPADLQGSGGGEGTGSGGEAGAGGQGGSGGGGSGADAAAQTGQAPSGTGNASGDAGGQPDSQADILGQSGGGGEGGGQSGGTGQQSGGSGEGQGGGTGAAGQAGGQPQQAAPTGSRPEQPEPGLQPERMGTIYRADELVGSTVLDSGDQEAGTVTDIILTDRGRLAYLVVDLESFSPMQSGRYLVRIEDVQAEPGEQRPRVRLEVGQPDRELILVQNDLQIRQQIDRNSVLYTSFMRYRVTGRDGKGIGAIEDLVIDMEATEVVYAAFVPGGELGAGGNLIAMPWRDISFDVESRFVRIDTDLKELERAETFSGDDWPAEASLNWRPLFE